MIENSENKQFRVVVLSVVQTKNNFRRENFYSRENRVASVWPSSGVRVLESRVHGLGKDTKIRVKVKRLRTPAYGIIRTMNVYVRCTRVLEYFVLGQP